MMTPTDPATRLRGLLSTSRIVFLVVAAAAPLVAMAGTVPLSIGVGNGAGVPGSYLFATVTLLLFSVGYAAMSRRITQGGGFYTYVDRGLGRAPAAAAAVFAVVAYNALAAALAGGVGYFLASGLGLPVPWWALSAVAIAVMALLGYRSIDVSARVLAILMCCEIGILGLFDIAVVVHHGLTAFPATSFTPAAVASGAPGVAFMFAFGSFAGFESAALYAEETPNPTRSVPRATYAAVLVIGVFYVLTSWLMIGAIGAERARGVAAHASGQLLLRLAHGQLGAQVAQVVGLLIITSVFASLVSAHNASSRYLLSLGRTRMLPAGLARVHHAHHSPYRSSLAQSGLTALVVAAFAIAGFDPYRQLVTIMSGLSTLGILCLQTMAAIAICAYFRRTGDRRFLSTLVAPVLGGAGLLGATVLLLANFSTLAGTDSVIVGVLPYLVLAAALAAALWTALTRHERPGVGGNGAVPGDTETAE